VPDFPKRGSLAGCVHNWNRMELTLVQDFAIQARVASVIGATVFDRVFVGVSPKRMDRCSTSIRETNRAPQRSTTIFPLLLTAKASTGLRSVSIVKSSAIAVRSSAFRPLLLRLARLQQQCITGWPANEPHQALGSFEIPINRASSRFSAHDRRTSSSAAVHGLVSELDAVIVVHCPSSSGVALLEQSRTKDGFPCGKCY
jgi:hypothetical protein